MEILEATAIVAVLDLLLTNQDMAVVSEEAAEIIKGSTTAVIKAIEETRLRQSG